MCPLYNIDKVWLVGSELLLRLLVTASHEQDRRVKWPKYKKSLGSNKIRQQGPSETCGVARFRIVSEPRMDGGRKVDADQCLKHPSLEILASDS